MRILKLSAVRTFCPRAGLVGLACLLAACQMQVGNEREATRYAPRPPAPSAEEMRRAQDILLEANRFRARQGLKPLTLESHLMLAAKRHAHDIVRDYRLSHRGSGGTLVEDRVIAVGYRYNLVTENIAARRKTFRGTVEQWRIPPAGWTD